MASPGYFLDHVDGNSDLYVCASCVQKFDKSTENPVNAEAFAIVPMSCGFHVYGGDPKDYE